MSFKDSDQHRKDYLDHLTVPILMDEPSRWNPDKVFLYADRIAQLQKWWEDRSNTPPGPVVLGAHIENKCNEKCPHCSGFRSFTGATNSLPFETFTWTIDEMVDLGLRGVQFSGGGEPWIHPHATDMAAYCKHKGLAVGVISNGTAFTEADCEALANMCLWIRISFDAASPEVREWSHGVNYWDRLIENCKLLKKHAHKDLTLGAGFLVSDETVRDAARFIDLCEDLGFTYAQFRPYQLVDQEWYPEHLDAAVTELVAANQDREIEVVSSGWRKSDEKFCRHYNYCFGAFFRTEINANSYIYPCCHLYSDIRNAFGKVEKPGDFTEIWNSKNMDRVDVSHCTEHCIYHQINERLIKFFQEYDHEEFF